MLCYIPIHAPACFLPLQLLSAPIYIPAHVHYATSVLSVVCLLSSYIHQKTFPFHFRSQILFHSDVVPSYLYQCLLFFSWYIKSDWESWRAIKAKKNLRAMKCIIIIKTITADGFPLSPIVSLLSQSEYSPYQCSLAREVRLLPTMERQTDDCSAAHCLALPLVHTQ